MPRVFHPGHRPNQPLYPDELVYATVQKVSEFLQLPLPDPVTLADNTSTALGSAIDASLVPGTTYIKIPIGGADYRRWGFSAGDSVTVYDNVESMGSELTLVLVKSAGAGGKVNLIGVDPGTAYTTAESAVVQANSSISNSKERGLSKALVEDLIRQRQDYIDRTTRMAWRPQLVCDEYKNFTTFKPYRRRYYTDYVGAVYLNNRAIQRVLRLSVWQGDYYRELGSSRIKMAVTNPTQIQASDKIFLCPGGVNATATLEQGATSTKWKKDFGIKTIAQDIANLINQDHASEKTAIQVGSLTEGTDSSGIARPLNVNHEFLATANSDDGDGNVMISSMRSTDEGDMTTIATTNTNSFSFTLGRSANSDLISTSGGPPPTSFTLADGGSFVEGNSIVYIEGTNGAVHVGHCSKSNNVFTILNDLTSSFAANLGSIGSITVVSNGAGYTSAPTVSITTDGAGAGATATATIDAVAGIVTGITVTDGGSGYLNSDLITVSISGGGGAGAAGNAVVSKIKQHRFDTDTTSEERQKDWWSMEDNGALMFNNQYPFFENHSLKVSYVYGERYVDKMIEDACIKLVAMDIMMSDDYSVMFPEGTQNIDLNAKVQRLDEEAKRLLVPFQESIIVAGMGG